MSRGQQPHGVDGVLLAQLVDDLLDLLVVTQHLDGDAGHPRVVGGSHGQGLDVVPFPGEQAGHLAEHAGRVFHQDGQGVSFVVGSIHSQSPSFNPAGNR